MIALASLLLLAAGGHVPDLYGSTAANLGLSDDQFWTSLDDEPSAAEPPAGLVLAAPTRVELGRRKDLPVVVRRRSSLRTAAQAPLSAFAVLVALDPQRDELWAARLGEREDDEPPFEAPSPEDLEAMGDGLTTELLQADARDRLHLPWHPAKLKLIALAQGEHSEAREVRLEGPHAAPAAHQHEAKLAPPWHPAVVPDRPGITLEAQGAALRGAVRLGPHDKSAVVHLVFVFRDDGFASPRSFRVPLQSGAGGFTLGPAELAGLNPGRATLVWAFVREAISVATPYTLPR